MRQVLAIARRELHSYFRSPVALIFLGTFLAVVLFSFFWVDTFFRRNIADVRPLFHWLPLLLIFLVAALTMRLWSDEQRMGSLEILLTLPVKTHRLVLGKFLAGLALVGLALILTIGLPLTVSRLGDLDWGPVLGGYLGAMLLAAAYLAIGLCISATTHNPVVALIGTVVACGLLYLIGTDAVAPLWGTRGSEILQAFGTGSRFESIQRGVVDLRDLVYYGSLCVGFLFLNTAILDSKGWSAGTATAPIRLSTKLAVGLVMANLLVLNLLLNPYKGARFDMTERKEYSISKVTQELLQGLDTPLLIRGYFSAKTHPKLAPLVPQIRDLLEEYAAVGGSMVRTEFIDPQTSPELEKEANEAYGIKSVPFQFKDRHEAAVVNSYFTLLVKYGDKFEKLSFQDLIEVKVTGMTDVEVKLRNLEYDLTKTIKKVAYGFQPLESLFARAPGQVKLRAYITPKTLPDNLQKIPGQLKAVAEALKKRSAGKMDFEVVDPSGPDKEALRVTLYEKYGLRPMALSLFSQQGFYLHLLLEVGTQTAQLQLAEAGSEADIREALTATLKRLTPGFLKTIGLVAAKAQMPPHNPMMGGRPPMPPPQYQMLRSKLSETYAVKDAEIKDGVVAGDIDILVVLGPDSLSEKDRYAIDQFLMRGGAVVIGAGSFAMDTVAMGRGGGLMLKKVETGLDPLLKHWGISVASELLLDSQNEPFPIPVQRNLGGMQIQEIQLVDYPFFPEIRQDGMAEGNLIVSGLPSITTHWASPIALEKKEGLEQVVLLRSSPKSWTQTSTDIQPDFDKYPKAGFAAPQDATFKSHAVAVAVSGTFHSLYADKATPLDPQGSKDATAPPAKKSAAEHGGRAITKSPDSARLVVISSSEFVKDIVLDLSRQTGSEKFLSNVQLLQNIADWAVADVDMLSIRSRGHYARTLLPLKSSERTTWESVNYGLVILALALIVGLNYSRRRSIKPLPITKRAQRREA